MRMPEVLVTGDLGRKDKGLYHVSPSCPGDGPGLLATPERDYLYALVVILQDGLYLSTAFLHNDSLVLSVGRTVESPAVAA